MNKYINAKRRGSKNNPVFVKERMRGKLRVALVNQILESFSSICKPKKYLLKPSCPVIFLKINFKLKKKKSIFLLSFSRNASFGALPEKQSSKGVFLPPPSAIQIYFLQFIFYQFMRKLPSSNKAVSCSHRVLTSVKFRDDIRVKDRRGF